jgi:glucokinase
MGHRSLISAMEHQEAPQDLLVGVDVGGTKVAVLVTDGLANVLSRTSMPTLLDSQETTVGGIAQAIQQGVSLAGATMRDVAAVGLGVPGRVDTQTGVVRQAVNLNWQELAVGEHLSSLLGVPCFLENDVRLAAAGLKRHPDYVAVKNLAYVSVGTGISAGLILDGGLYRGTHGMAGEIGHTILDPQGPHCICGARGCLEAMAAGPAIARLGEEAVESGVDTVLRLRGREPAGVTAQVVYDAAREGDAAAQAIARRIARYLAQALYLMIMTYDVERIVLGGGVSRAGDAFFQPILHELQRMRRESDLAFEMIRPGAIDLLPHDYDAGVWGAVTLAQRVASGKR